MHVWVGSFSTESVGFAFRLTSASLRKRPNCCAAAKYREGPFAVIGQLVKVSRPSTEAASLMIILREYFSMA
jgi:hypothetical protein